MIKDYSHSYEEEFLARLHIVLFIKTQNSFFNRFDLFWVVAALIMKYRYVELLCCGKMLWSVDLVLVCLIWDAKPGVTLTKLRFITPYLVSRYLYCTTHDWK